MHSLSQYHIKEAQLIWTWPAKLTKKKPISNSKEKIDELWRSVPWNPTTARDYCFWTAAEGTEILQTSNCFWTAVEGTEILQTSNSFWRIAESIEISAHTNLFHPTPQRPLTTIPVHQHSTTPAPHN